MFERFTDGARRVVVNAQAEARRLNHNYMGTEHLLLGMIREGEGVAVQVLAKRGADLSRLRDRVIELLVQRAAGEEPAGERPHVRPVTRGPFTAGMGFLWAGPAPKLVRVVPLARHVEVGEDAQLVLLSLEIWSNWLDLRLATAGPPGTQPATAHGDWTLSDDRGTRYRTSGVTFSGNQELQICQVSFQPSPPADAGTLTLTLPGEGKARDEIRVVVELA